MPVYLKRMFCVTCLLLGVSAQAAQVYMSRDADGNIVFSDRAEGKAERINVQELPTVPAYMVPDRLKQAGTTTATTAPAPATISTPLSTTAPVIAPPMETAPAKTKSTKVPPDYQSLSIVSPRSGETYQNGDANNLMVIAEIQPSMKEDDALQLFDNGTLIRHTRTNYFAVNDLERGEHKLEVAIVSKEGKEKIRSEGVIVYIHRNSILKNARD
ncbi:DUF4124 domain-containing protein [Parathalassolituus penaei]|uniref:DUF4124 domain-containing protein n=1 Tax=Parathalassolituus penaei TaxID=2997323 RepID=A0A9X3EB02_9GAMM|nr:DUF4124 domain-containing protein [Parathalassolituus penaei]MCY0964212.1 DUF4124 domain-containing protein [Parathalassolituus penaei]